MERDCIIVTTHPTCLLLSFSSSNGSCYPSSSPYVAVVPVLQLAAHAVAKELPEIRGQLNLFNLFSNHRRRYRMKRKWKLKIKIELYEIDVSKSNIIIII